MGASKGIPILISLDAHANTDGQPEDTMRLITTGQLFEAKDETVIRYEESLDEGEPQQQISITVRDSVITMSRQGAFFANMVFQKGKRYESQYQTPYGSMDMALYCTKAVHTRTQDGGGEIALQYQLDLSGQYAAMHDMKLHYMRKKEA